MRCICAHPGAERLDGPSAWALGWVREDPEDLFRGNQNVRPVDDEQ
jgi:hypothetical protein